MLARFQFSYFCHRCKTTQTSHRSPYNRLYCDPCWLAVDKIRVPALAEVGKARKRGDLADPSTLPCADCGKQASQYDHRDYTKPLEVEPVCASCNWKRGPAEREDAA